MSPVGRASERVSEREREINKREIAKYIEVERERGSKRESDIYRERDKERGR